MLPFLYFLRVGLYSPLNYLQHLAAIHFILVKVVDGGRKLDKLLLSCFPIRVVFFFWCVVPRITFHLFHPTRENHIIAFPNFLSVRIAAALWVCVCVFDVIQGFPWDIISNDIITLSMSTASIIQFNISYSSPHMTSNETIWNHISCHTNWKLNRIFIVIKLTRITFACWKATT